MAGRLYSAFAVLAIMGVLAGAFPCARFGCAAEGQGPVAGQGAQPPDVPTPQATTQPPEPATPPAAGLIMGQGRAQLSLSETIEMALRTNLEIRILGYQPRISALAVDREQSVFDPVYGAALNHTSRHSPTLESKSYVARPFPNIAHAKSTTDTDIISYDTSLAVRSGIGGAFSISTGVARNDVSTAFSAIGTTSDSVSVTHQQYYDGNITLRMTQPLLKNAGAVVNQANLRIARNNARGSTYDFEDQVMNLVLKTSNSYWNLVFYREDLRSREKSLQAAQDLLKNNQVKFEAGALPKIEVTRARTRVADREEAIVTAKASIKDAEDSLRGIFDSADFELLSSSEIVPSDEPAVFAEQLDVPAAVHEAMVLRPDVRQQVLNVESTGIQVARMKHQLLPQVDIEATYRLNSYGDGWGENFSATRPGDREIGIGLTLSMPLGARLVRSEYARSRYERFQALVSLELLQRNVTLAVKKTVRDIATSVQRIDTNQLRRQYAQENLEAEVQKYEVGQSISLDVLDAQQQLQQAESAYIQSKVAFNQAMAAYYRTTGRILQKYGIEVVDLATVKKGSDTLSQ